MFAIYKFIEEESGFVSLHEIALNTHFPHKVGSLFFEPLMLSMKTVKRRMKSSHV